MAALNTADLEVLVEAAINNRKVGMELLNVLRIANGKHPHPDTYGRGDLNHIHDSEWRSAMGNVLADVATAVDSTGATYRAEPVAVVTP